MSVANLCTLHHRSKELAIVPHSLTWFPSSLTSCLKTTSYSSDQMKGCHHWIIQKQTASTRDPHIVSESRFRLQIIVGLIHPRVLHLQMPTVRGTSITIPIILCGFIRHHVLRQNPKLLKTSLMVLTTLDWPEKPQTLVIISCAIFHGTLVFFSLQ